MQEPNLSIRVLELGPRPVYVGVLDVTYDLPACGRRSTWQGDAHQVSSSFFYESHENHLGQTNPGL